MISKHFVNETHNEIEITLYIAGREGNQLKTSGSQVLTIAGGCNATVPINDLRSAFLQGISIKTTHQGESMSLQRGTKEANGPLYTLLNQYDSFRIGENKSSFAIEALIEDI